MLQSVLVVSIHSWKNACMVFKRKWLILWLILLPMWTKSIVNNRIYLTYLYQRISFFRYVIETNLEVAVVWPGSTIRSLCVSVKVIKRTGYETPFQVISLLIARAVRLKYWHGWYPGPLEYQSDLESYSEWPSTWRTPRRKSWGRKSELCHEGRGAVSTLYLSTTAAWHYIRDRILRFRWPILVLVIQFVLLIGTISWFAWSIQTHRSRSFPKTLLKVLLLSLPQYSTFLTLIGSILSLITTLWVFGPVKFSIRWSAWLAFLPKLSGFLSMSY